MKTMLFGLSAIVMTASALAKRRPIKEDWTLCDPVLNWCKRGRQCVDVVLATSGYRESEAYKRCAPCPYKRQTGEKVTLPDRFKIANDPSYTGSGGAWASNREWNADLTCPKPRVNLKNFPDPMKNKKSTGFSCSSTDFKKLAIGTWEMLTINFQLVNELVILIIPAGDFKKIMVNLKKGFNAGPGAIGFGMATGYYIAEEVEVGDILCEIAGYFYVVVNIFSQVANFADE